MEIEYYVYIYFDPRVNPSIPIYVGKGHGDRYKHHLIKGAKNIHLFNKIEKIKEFGMEPIIEFAKTGMTNQEAILLEVELIQRFGRADKKTGTLCNWTDGGEGTAGYKHSKKTKELFSKQRKGKKQTENQYKANCNRVISESTREKMSKANIGHSRHTKEQIESIRKYNITREITDDMRKKWSKTRLGNTKTKIKYPPISELVSMIEKSSKNKVAKQLGVNFSSLNKYLKRRNIETKDARFSS